MGSKREGLEVVDGQVARGVQARNESLDEALGRIQRWAMVAEQGRRCLESKIAKM